MTQKLIWTEEELSQGSQEWLQWRNDDGKGVTLGGSEIASLMYMSPFTTLHDLFREKMGLQAKEFSESAMAAMERGNTLEPIARNYYAKNRGVEVRQLCAIHPTKPWMRTSLDGITSDNKVILEIKAPSSFDKHVKQTKRGRVPDYRYPQMQWQLAVMREHYEGVERVDYVSFWVDNLDVQDDGISFTNVDMKVIPIYPDNAFITEMTRRGEIFASYLRSGVTPPATLFIENLPLVVSYPTPRRAADAPPKFF